MTGPDASRTWRRPAALAVAAGLVVGLPLAALFLGPAASAGSGPPGSQLAGLNTTATATGIQVAPYTPGIVGAGNVVQGNLVEVAVPYASSAVGTGPSTSGTASPAYPGETAANAGNALQTFDPTLPNSFVALLNDPILAQSTYPPQVHTGASGSYQPPGASLIGVGTASTQSGPAATTATAALSNSSLLGALSLVQVGSATSDTSATLQAASVATTARTVLGHINIAGLVDISGISSEATASSDGTVGQQTSTLHIGAVTVAGLAASIGPDGISLNQIGLLGQLGLVPIANQALTALQALGLSVTTLAPTRQQDGSSASASSGGLQISFKDAHVPNPQGQLPIGSSVGIDIDLGLSVASANATALPPFTLPGAVTPPGPVATVPPSTGTPAIGTGSGSGAGSAVSLGSPAAAVPTPQLGSPAPAPSAAPAAPASSGSGPVPVLAGFLGIPVRVAWVVAAFVLSIIAAGPLLAYANWQLLRGRTP